MRLLLFEDERWRDLAPLTDLHAVPDLAFGASTLGQRWVARAGEGAVAAPGAARATAFGADGVHRRPLEGDEDVLVANAAALPGAWSDEILRPGPPVLLARGDRVLAARVPAARLRPGLGGGEDFGRFLSSLGLPRHDVEARIVEWPWQMVEWNAAAIAEDLAGNPGPHGGSAHHRAWLEHPERISIGPGARVDALAVLDAREGPIAIGAGCVVLPHTHVIGPCAVGAGTHLLGGAIGRSTIGPGCRIAGEVDESIWQGWANKRHHGFVGHSIVGEWSNLGALTTTSDLKNNYGVIRAHGGGRERDTGLIKLGAILGTGVKTGIGTLLPTGAVIGTGSHLFGGGRYAPKHLEAFAWWDGERADVYDIDKFIATARMASSRRDRTLTAGQEQALRDLFAARRAAHI